MAAPIPPPPPPPPGFLHPIPPLFRGEDFDQDETYYTYDRWLELQDLDPLTIPEPGLQPRVHDLYRDYLGKTDDQRKGILYQHFQRGDVRAYGIPMPAYGYSQDFGGHEAVAYGPTDWYEWHRRFGDLGQERTIAFDKIPRFEQILNDHGYILGYQMAEGEAGRYDNQIWSVVKLHTPGSAQHDYACKVVHIMNFENTHTMREAGEQVLKEARLLMEINHNFIIKVFENIYVEESTTNFPFLIILSVMEMMRSDLDSIIEESTFWVLPNQTCFWCLNDISRAVNYLHNEIRNPGGQWMRVVHMAIKPENILVRNDNQRERENDFPLIFKLADFEECIVYNRDFPRRDGWNGNDADSHPPDVLANINFEPYYTHCSAPEVMYSEPQNRHLLRLMPNDVYSLAKTIVWGRIGYTSQGMQQRFDGMNQMIGNWRTNGTEHGSLEDLLRIATLDNPEERATIIDVLAHPFLAGGAPPPPPPPQPPAPDDNFEVTY